MMFRVYQILRTGFQIFILTFTFVGFQNCSQPYSVTPVPAGTNQGGPLGSPQTGNPKPDPSPVPPVEPPCTPQTTTTDLRIMFVVDESGSTVTTDPDASLRTKTAEYFIKANLNNSLLSYSYSYFFDDAFVFDYSQQNFVSPVFLQNPIGSANQTLQVTYKFRDDFINNRMRSGGTNYEVALKTAADLIQKDKAINSQMSYVVIFMSDGLPTRGGAEIGNYVNTIRASAGGPDRATVSSVYFGESHNLTAKQVMIDVASYGGGEYVDSNTTQLTFANMIQNIIQVPTGACLPK